jgi:hypothetical protein
LWLTQHNVPFDVAFSLDDTTRYAWSIIVSEQQSNRAFDWSKKEFVEHT